MPSRIRRRHSCTNCYVVAALRDRSLDLERARMSSPIEIEKFPVRALSDVGADIIVVCSRGLRGARALGSVSERVAHRSDASVLVVHGRTGSRNDDRSRRKGL